MMRAIAGGEPEPIGPPLVSECVVQDRFIVGVDLGQSQDFTAIIVLDRHERVRTTDQRYSYEIQPRSTTERKGLYHVPYIERLKLGVSYPDVVRYITDIIRGLPERPKPPVLVIDGTGVGRAVVDLFREARMSPVAVSITAGRDVGEPGGNAFTVPKRDLVGVISILLQSRRLRIAKSLRHGETLIEELLNFKVRISASGHDTYEAWREKIHDDLVLAMAVAAWFGERRLPTAKTVPFSLIAGR